jgi:hypothetical protein
MFLPLGMAAFCTGCGKDMIVFTSYNILIKNIFLLIQKNYWWLRTAFVLWKIMGKDTEILLSTAPSTTTFLSIYISIIIEGGWRSGE